MGMRQGIYLWSVYIILHSNCFLLYICKWFSLSLWAILYIFCYTHLTCSNWLKMNLWVFSLLKALYGMYPYKLYEDEYLYVNVKMILIFQTEIAALQTRKGLTESSEVANLQSAWTGRGSPSNWIYQTNGIQSKCFW